MIEEAIATWAVRVAVLLDAAATLVIAAGSVQAMVRAASVFGKPNQSAHIVPIRRRLSEWLALALELLIGSDIIRTAISPTWTDLGQLGAIVVLRIVINYTLMNDIKAEAPDA